MKLKKVLQLTLSFVFAITFSLGLCLMFLPKTTASASSAGAEWYTGNSEVTATLNYDYKNSDYYAKGWYYGFTYNGVSTTGNTMSIADAIQLTDYNQALQAEGFWTETDYVENFDYTPLFLQSVVGAETPTINLGYYETTKPFMMSSQAVQSGIPNVDYYKRANNGWKFDRNYVDATRMDYNGLIYTFTDLYTGNYFKVKVISDCLTSAMRERSTISISYNGGDFDTNETRIHYYFAGKHAELFGNGSNAKNTYVFNFLNIKYDSENNVIKHGYGLDKSIELSNFGVPTFNNYKVDMEFLNVKDGKTAGLAVYFLNGYDLNDIEDASELDGTDKVLYQKTDTLNLNDFTADVNDVIGVWNSAKGDVKEEITATVKDSLGNDLTVENGKFDVENGTYTVTATYNEQSITANVEITVPGNTTVPTAEWFSGNSEVTATMNYDLKNSVYGENGWYYGADGRTEYVNLVDKNADLENEGFWIEEDYYNMNFRPLFYQSVLGAETPSINLGYFTDDFMMSSHAVQDGEANTQFYARTSDGYNSNAVDANRFDYNGLVYTFTDLDTDVSFKIKYESIGGSGSPRERCNISVSYDDGVTYASVVSGGNFYYFGGRTCGGYGDATKYTLYNLNVKYDKDLNAIKYGTALTNKYQLTTETLGNYKVDMEFLNVKDGKTAGLMVYFLNGYELHNESKYTMNDNEHGEVMFKNNDQVTTTDGTVALADTVKVWNNYDGFVADGIEYSVVDKNSNPVSVVDGKFTATGAGVYTVTATYGNLTETVDLNVSYPTGGVIIKQARLNLEGKIGVQFKVSADSNLYDSEGGKAVFTVADEVIEVPFVEWTRDGSDYVVECKVAAKQMTDDITVKAVDKNGAETGELTYSVKQYADAILSSNGSSEELKALVKATLNYGAYAQVYFDYNTEKLANEGLFDGENPVDSLTEITDATLSATGSVDGVALRSLSLSLESETAISLFFTLDSVEINDARFTFGGNELTATEWESGYIVVIPNIAAKDIDEVYEISVTANDQTVTYTVSAQTYLAKAFGKVDNINYNNLLKAIQLYNVAANGYFATK